MPLALYLDVHVPRAITNGLRRRGVEVLTAQEDGSAELDDPPLLERATELNRPFYTQDDATCPVRQLGFARVRSSASLPAGITFMR